MSLRFLLRGQMRYMASKGIDVYMASADGDELRDVISHEGCPHKTFDLSRSITPVRDFITLIKLTVWLRQQRFDVVHSHTPKAGLIAMMASYLARVPVRAHTIAGIPWMESAGLRRTLLKYVDKLAYACATNVYPNSYELMKFVTDQKLASRSKVKVIGNGSSNGIDTGYFSAESVDKTRQELRGEYGIPKDAFVFVFVGRIVKDKGMNELFQAFSRMPGDCHLVLVGPLESDLDPISEEALDFFQSAVNVHMMGYQHDVRPFLLLSDVLVFPSYREGFPNVPLQAGAMGLPCIVTDINGCNEIVVEGENGLLVPPKNDELLLKAMERVRKEIQLFELMRSNARRMTHARFGQQYMQESVYKEYMELTANV